MNDELKKEKEKNKRKKVCIVMLIIIIIILLLLIWCLWKNYSGKKLTPTGNIDVFEIICNKNCDCSLDGKVEAYDSNAVWESESKLRIFENPVYMMDSIIAPLSSNSYQFVIKNTISDEVVYDLKFSEVNNFNINMKYRLKKNDQYVVGSDNEWVTYEKLNLTLNNISTDSEDVYILDWKWFESNNDTEIGSVNSDYQLNIILSATQSI